MDSLARSILEVIVKQGGVMARDLLVDGVDLVLRRVKYGTPNERASDQEVMNWLRDAQAGDETL